MVLATQPNGATLSRQQYGDAFAVQVPKVCCIVFLFFSRVCELRLEDLKKQALALAAVVRNAFGSFSVSICCMTFFYSAPAPSHGFNVYGAKQGFAILEFCDVCWRCDY